MKYFDYESVAREAKILAEKLWKLVKRRLKKVLSASFGVGDGNQLIECRGGILAP
jgi:hypothetical protein